MITAEGTPNTEKSMSEEVRAKYDEAITKAVSEGADINSIKIVSIDRPEDVIANPNPGYTEIFSWNSGGEVHLTDSSGQLPDADFQPYKKVLVKLPNAEK